MCQDLRNLFEKHPPDIDWFVKRFGNLSGCDYISLIILENLSEVWSSSEFSTVEKKLEEQFLACHQKKTLAARQELEEAHPDGYVMKSETGEPLMSIDAWMNLREDFAQTRLSFFKNLFVLFQGDVKTFISRWCFGADPTSEDIGALGSALITQGLFRGARTCLESIPTPELCEEHECWHENYNLVLRYTGLHEKAISLRWEYFLAVQTHQAMVFYLDPLAEQLNIRVEEDRTVACIDRCDEHVMKVNQAIIHKLPLEKAIDFSIRLRHAPACQGLMDDLMLHHYGGDELFRCPHYALQNLLRKIEDERESGFGKEKLTIPKLAPLIASRTLIQSKWRNKNQMSAKKAKQLNQLIDQAQARDRELQRTPSTQHIPSHQEFMNRLEAKHSPKITSSSLSSPTLSL